MPIGCCHLLDDGPAGGVTAWPGVQSIRGAGHAGRVAPDNQRHSENEGTFSAQCPFTIDHPIMAQRWERLTFVHWSFDPPAVQRLVPEWLQVETFDGAAWVGVVPFFMRVATAHGHSVSWVSHFCETNVRTYVRDREGRSGIWFFSLDAARLGAVLTAPRPTGFHTSGHGCAFRNATVRSRIRVAGAGPTRSPALRVGSMCGPGHRSRRQNSTTVITSSQPAGCCSAPRATGHVSRVRGTRPGRCIEPNPSPSTIN